MASPSNNMESGPSGKDLIRGLLHLSPFYKILVANSAMVCVSLGAGAWLIHANAGKLPREVSVLAALLGIIVASILVNSLLIHFALAPVEDLSATMNRITAGDFRLRARYHPLGGRSINQAVESLNRMLDTLESAYASLEKERERSRQQARLILFAQEEERKRIARELHDETSQVLATLLIGLGELEQKMPGTIVQCGVCRGDMSRLKELTDRTITELHRLAYNLRPSLLDDMGLRQAISWLLREQIDKKGIAARLVWKGPDSHLPGELEIAFFRVAQEALTNVVKYAKAASLAVSVERDAEQVSMTIADDGVGFDTALLSRDKEKHLGIFGMQERVALLAGRFAIHSTPGKGTTVQVTVPLHPEKIQEELKSR